MAITQPITVGLKRVTDAYKAFFVRNGSGTEFPIYDTNGNIYSAGSVVTSTYRKAYFVDCNGGSDSNDGLSWDTAYKKLSVALAASHANIALDSKGWAARNVIFFKGDQTATADGENLTKLAQKTDIIGVGSTDWKARPQLVGKHVIDNSVSYMGCRFINVSFKGTILSGGDIFTLTSQHGIEFINCEFNGDTTTPGTAAVVATACVDLHFINCESRGAFSDAVIELGAGQADGFKVIGCYLQGANMGIDIASTTTYAANKCGIIKDNVISSTLACINDALGKTFVINNRLRTAANKGTAMAGCIVCGITYAQDNRCTTGDANNVVYPAQGTI